jgi:hypothetical protein
MGGQLVARWLQAGRCRIGERSSDPTRISLTGRPTEGHQRSRKAYVFQRTLPSANFLEAPADRLDGQVLLGVVGEIDRDLVLLAVIDL